jgi:hypothetical protein
MAALKALLKFLLRLAGLVVGIIVAAWIVVLVMSNATSPTSSSASSTSTRTSISRALSRAGPCSPSDFVISKLNANSPGYGYVNINGMLTNNCAVAAGAQLKVVFYDKEGNIISSSDSWPASIRNIPPGSDFVFKLITSPAEASGMKKYTVQVQDAKVW